jgi:hypothetical protein
MPVIHRPSEDAQPHREGYIIPGYAPLGELVLLHGSDGAGKTAVALSACAAVTRDRAWPPPVPREFVPRSRRPDEPLPRRVLMRRPPTPAAPQPQHCGCVIISDEDNRERIDARLRAMDANMQHVRIVDTTDGEPWLLSQHLAMLRTLMEEVDAAVVVLDTIGKVMACSMKDYQATAHELRPLRALLRERRAACLALNHDDKAGRQPLGSQNLQATARCRWHCIPDPDAREPHQFLLRVERLSFGGEWPAARRYETVRRSGDVIVVNWGLPAPHHDGLSHKRQREIWVESLIEAALQGGPLPWNDLLDAIKQQDTAAPSALLEARMRLQDRRVIAQRRIGAGRGSHVVWYLMEHADQVHNLLHSLADDNPVIPIPTDEP